MSDIQALLSALDVFSRAPDKVSLENANSWLQDFQHSVNLISSPNIVTSGSDSGSHIVARSMVDLQCPTALS
jgi:transportin-3